MITPGLAGTVLADVRDMQPPFIAALLIGGCAAKASQLIRARSIARVSPGGRPPGLIRGRGGVPRRRVPVEPADARRVPGGRPPGLTPLRKPLAMLMCGAELSLALALLVTMLPASTHPGTPLFAPRAATGARVAAAAFFLVAGSALIELRGRRPALGCGCFGDLSTRPPGLRSIARAAMLTVAALISLNTPALYLPPRGQGAMLFLGLMAAEVALLAALSPEVGEALVRLGYTDPCERRALPVTRTLAALHRSRPWRRYRSGITTTEPADVWRELCWRYVAFPYRQGEGGARPDADIVFAVEMKRRRPAVRAAVVPRSLRAGQPAVLSGPLPESRLSAREPHRARETGGRRTARAGVTLAGRAGTGRNAAR
jgi:hypothetical protein